MYGIIPGEHMREVFDRIVLPAIERFFMQGRVCYICNFFGNIFIV